MIIEVTMFALECDNCKEEFEDSHTGFSATYDSGRISEMATDSGWHETEAGAHYCPDCHSIDDDDNLVIHPVKEKP